MNYLDIFFSSVEKATIRMLLGKVASENLHLKQLDMRNISPWQVKEKVCGYIYVCVRVYIYK